MANKKQRMSNRNTAMRLHYTLPPATRCPRCSEPCHQGHYVPASFGQPGFYICELELQKQA